MVGGIETVVLALDAAPKMREQSVRKVLKGDNLMKLSLIMAAPLILALAGSGCATKKYVAKAIAPVEAKVNENQASTQAKDTDQDKRLADTSKQIDELGTDLSRTKERLTDTDAKAVAAGNAANQAGQRADGAQRAADGARTLAQTGVERADAASQRVTKAAENMDKLVKYQMLKTETVLFPVNQFKLSSESKAQLDDVAKMISSQERYMVEVQGYTDKTGGADLNQQLSQQRAAEVVRYLVNEHKIPVRTISSIGSGYTAPVADDSTRDGRKMNRRVEVRLFVPEITSVSNALAQN
jgi:outer membrane protein OmpA-like peptidoglycan-associated protein